jgi:hypothetical protein
MDGIILTKEYLVFFPKDFIEGKKGRGLNYNPFKPIEIRNPIDTAKEYYTEAKRVVYGNTDYSTKARQLIDKFGNEPIQRITIIRNPVPDYLIEILNVVSFGDFKKKLKETEYDKLFHLAVVFDTPKGKLLLEKNEVINLSESIPKEEGREDRNVPINKQLTVKELLDNTEKRMGKDLYYKYSAYDNNCQNFILNVLKANDLGDSADFEFVKQDTEELFKSNPYLRKLSNSVTDIASRFTGKGPAFKKSRVVQKQPDRQRNVVGGLIVKANPFNDDPKYYK